MNEKFAISIVENGELNKLVLCGNVNEIVAYTITAVKLIYDKIDKTNKWLAEYFKEMLIYSIAEGIPFMNDEELDKVTEAVLKKKMGKKLFSGKDE